jgi:flagellar biosynthesis regulator FlbT
MSDTTKTSLDKIKFLDQMMEDLAGDEFEDFDVSESGISASVKHHDIAEDLDEIDVLH